jgi:hypothetical protein
MTFQVQVRGELGSLVKAMERMAATPYEHRIKSLSIERSETSTAKDAGTKECDKRNCPGRIAEQRPRCGGPFHDEKLSGT